MNNTITINPQNPDSDYAAIDIIDKSIIAEGTTIKEVIAKADKAGDAYVLMFLPKKGQTYIY
jgi:hypothetical protein